jgi:hypothetical protein
MGGQAAMRSFSLDSTVDVLRRTPRVLHVLLDGVADPRVRANEGGESWSAFDIVGHLIHGEKTDWILRAKLILGNSGQPFEAFDRFAQFEASEGKSLSILLDEFSALRKRNLEVLASLPITEATLSRQGIHPEFGPVTLAELLATWGVHDLGHIAQITRVMAKYDAALVGAWRDYLPILSR